jgi:probable F420-dependent oxidoreductase
LAPQLLVATPAGGLREQLRRIETLGYGSVWSGETPADSLAGGREAFALHGLMLAATDRIVVGTGIANISIREPVAMHTGAATLAEAYPGRFVLGLGGHRGDRPLAALGAYLDAMDAAAAGLLPGVDYPRLLAALGPRAHRLALERADGVHPFLQPVAHTGRARAALGTGPLLVPHQAVLLEPDPERARGLLRGMSAGVRTADSPYTRHYRRLGYTDLDLANGRSDRLLDALLGHGDVAAVAGRLREHLDAGADHVLLQPLARDLPTFVDQLAELAPALSLTR